jgi:hypothetical protein
MRFFRHFSDASSSLTIQKIIDEMGVEGYGQYFLLLELLNSKFDGSSTKIALHSDEISAKVRIKFTKKLETFVQKLADFCVLSFELSGKVYQIDCPVLAELMDKDSKYNRKKLAPCEESAKPRIKKENKKKIKKEKENKEIYGIHESIADDFLKPFFVEVKIQTQEAWFKIYPDRNWIKVELIKGANWLITSDAIRKDKGRFFTNWLSNAVEYQKRNTKQSKSDFYQGLADNNPYPEEVSA